MDLFSTSLKNRRKHPVHQPLTQLLERARAALRRGQQHFLNMMLLPTLGHGHHKVDLHFACPTLQPRQVTINVRPKDGSGLRMSGAAHLRHLERVVREYGQVIDGAGALLSMEENCGP